MKTKLKAVVTAVVAVIVSPEFKPVEVKLLRALAVAVLGAVGVKFGFTVA